jgi:hypothetical protein
LRSDVPFCNLYNSNPFDVFKNLFVIILNKKK